MLLRGWVCESNDPLIPRRPDRGSRTGPFLPFLTGMLSLQRLQAIYARDVLGDENDIILTTVLGAEAIVAAWDG